MRNIKRSLFIVLLSLVSISPLLAQSSAVEVYAKRQQQVGHHRQQPELRFTDVESYIQGDSLYLTFWVGVSGKLVGRGEVLHIVPSYEIGQKQYFMPELLVQDRLRDSYYRREIEVMTKESYLASRPYQVIVLDGERTDEHVNYHASLYLPDGVDRADASLRIYQILEDCCHFYEVGAYDIEVIGAGQRGLHSQAPSPVPEKKVAEKSSLPPLRLTPSDLVFYQPEAEEVKMRAERMTVRIQFQVARHEILPGYSTNAMELSKVRELLQPLLYGKPGDIEVTEASIKGYASPEGGFDYNQRLSERRALSFKNYLQTHYGGLGRLSYFPAIGMGEDWAGLREALVDRLDVPMRDQMIAIIDYVDIFSGREKQLMDLGGGRPYRYMLSTLYPHLRRMEMEVGYRVRGYLPNEVEGIFDRRPQDLSQAEIFEVAKRRNTPRTPLTQYGKEYDVAADYFPNDLTANLNASSAALIRGEYELACHYLERIKDAPEAALNIALYFWQKGDRDQVKKYLEVALTQPSIASRARTLLRQLK